MQFRLLVDLEVIEFLQGLPINRWRRLLAHFRSIQNFPGHFSDFIHQDDLGRRLDVSVIDEFAIYYWTDAADRHVKILKMTAAD